MAWVKVKNIVDEGICKFEIALKEDAAKYEIPFDRWALWKDKFGNVEKCRLKMDAYDHFSPSPKLIKSEEDLMAFWVPEGGDKNE